MAYLLFLNSLGGGTLDTSKGQRAEVTGVGVCVDVDLAPREFLVRERVLVLALA